MVLKTGQEIWHCGLKIRCYQLTKLLHYKMSSGGWLKWRKDKTHLEAAAPLSKKTLLSSSSLCLGARLAPCAIVRLSLLLSSSSPIPSPFPFLLLLSPFYGFITALLWVFLPPLVGFSSPFVAFYQSPWWLAAPWWQGVLDVATFVPLAYGLEASSNLSTSPWEIQIWVSHFLSSLVEIRSF